jgi:hypothetical protein
MIWGERFLRKHGMHVVLPNGRSIRIDLKRAEDRLSRIGKLEGFTAGQAIALKECAWASANKLPTCET